MKLTRRELAAALAATPVFAQTPAIPATPEAELEAARADVKANSMALSRIEVPITIEPAFVFKV
jgi:hypothetical protein